MCYCLYPTKVAAKKISHYSSEVWISFWGINLTKFLPGIAYNISKKTVVMLV